MHRRPGIWSDRSYLNKLPEHYYRFRRELEKPATRVHDKEEKGDLLDYYVADEKTLRIERRPDVPVQVIYPKEVDEGLWGGEGVVKGFVRYKGIYATLIPKYWFPSLQKTIFYSDILDKYMSVVVTERALLHIDAAFGFDNYILKTPVQDFKSQLALDLRRKMLVALAKKDFHPNDPKKQKTIYDKYKQFEIPLEEAEWVGLPLHKAVTKMKIIEAQREEAENPPLKVKFSRELLQKLKELKEKGELHSEVGATTWMGKIKEQLPFLDRK